MLGGKDVDRVVWSIAYKKAIDIGPGHGLASGDTALVLYPDTKSVVFISKSGMMPYEDKKAICRSLKETGMERQWWPAYFSLIGWRPLKVSVQAVDGSVVRLTLDDRA